MTTVQNPSGSHQSSTGRTIVLPIRGGSLLEVSCPSWCVASHTYELTEPYGTHITEIQHISRVYSLDVRIDEHNVLRVMTIRISQYPFSPEDVPTLIFDTAMDDSNCVEIDPQFLLQGADQVAAYVDVMREVHAEHARALEEYQAAMRSPLTPHQGQ